MVLQIAHRVSRTACSRALRRKHLPIRIPPRKTRMALYRIPPFIPFPIPHAGSCLVDHHAMPPLTTAQPGQ